MNELVLLGCKLVAILFVKMVVMPIESRLTSYLLLAVLALTHYGLAALASHDAIAAVTATLRGRAVVGWTLVITSVVIWYQPITILQYFILHNAFNEVYYWNQRTKTESSPSLNACRVFYHAVVLFVCSTDAYFGRAVGLFKLSAVPWVAAAVLLLGLAVWRVKFRSRYAEAMLVIFDASSLLFIVFAIRLGQPFRAYDVFIYHFIFWTLAPMVFAARDRRKTWINWVAVGVPLAFFAIYLGHQGIHDYFAKFHLRTWEYVATIGGFLHISTSFLFSPYHPQFIVDAARWLRGEAKVST